MAKNLRKLKDQAQKALNKGKHIKALDLYLELESAEPKDGGWARRVADMYRRLGRNEESLLSLERAADKYAKAGFVVKAVAVCKMILQADPSHVATQQKLAAFNSQRGITAGRAVAAGTGSVPARPATAPPVPPTPPPAASAPPADAGAIELDASDAGELELDTGFSMPEQPAKKVATEKALPPVESVELPPSVALPAEPPPPPATPPPIPTAATPPPTPPAARQAIVPPALSMSSPDIATAALAAAEAGAAAKPKKRTLPPGAPLDSISLSAFMPGAMPAGEVAGEEGTIQDIPLEFDLDSLMAEAEMAVDDSGSEALDASLELDDDETAEEAARRLHETPFFSALGPGLLESFIDKIKLVELQPGEVLFKQGDTGATLYVISEGEVAVYSEGPPRIQLSRLKEGDFFGEIALVTDQPRSATIEAIEATELLAIDRDTIGDLMDDEPGLLRVLLRFLRDRLFDTLIHTNALFGGFGGPERQQLAEKFRFLEGEAGAQLIQQGTKAQGLYILLAGQAEVLLERDDAAEPQRLATLGPGDLCGEMSLLAHDEAVASVRLTSKSFVLKLPADVFRQVIMTHPQVLMFVGDLADERKRQLTAIQDGEGDYEITHLDLL